MESNENLTSYTSEGALSEKGVEIFDKRRLARQLALKVARNRRTPSE